MPELNNTILKNSTNLKAYYRFESGALTTDSSGNGYTLTNNNTVGEATGVFGGAADGGSSNTNKYFSINDNLGIDGGSCTISMWIKLYSFPTTGTSFRAMQIDSTGTDTFQLINFYNDSGTQKVGFLRSKNGVAQQGNYWSYTPGTTWHHYVYTYNGTNIRGYIDGVQYGPVAASGNGTTNSTTKTSIMANTSGSECTSGIFDDVAIFNTALSADQIKELYEGRFLGEGWPQSGLVGLWHLNGNSTDFSGNNYHGTDTSMTYPAGKFGSCGNFSGSGYVSMGNVLDFERTNSWSVSLWFNIGSSASGQMLGKQNSAANYNGWTCGFNSGTPRFGMTGSNGTYLYIDGPSGYDNSKWHHLVGTYDGSQTTGGLLMYLDGAKITGSYGTGLNANITNAFPFEIGGRNGANYLLTGKLDEVAVFNVVKDANWVRKQYALGVGKYL